MSQISAVKAAGSLAPAAAAAAASPRPARTQQSSPFLLDIQGEPGQEGEN